MQRMIRRSLLAIPLAVTLLAACGSNSSKSGATNAVAKNGTKVGQSSSPITIGALLPQTGANASDGQSALNGINLAISQINAAGGVDGRQLKVDVVDNQSSNQGTVVGFTDLTSGAKPVAIIGPSVSSWVSAASPDIASAGIPFFFGGTLTSLTHQGNKWLFRDRPTDAYFAQGIVDYGVKNLHIKSWAIFHSSNSFGIAANQRLASGIKAAGGSVLADEGYQSGTTDFTSAVLALKRSGAKGLASFVTSAETYGVFAKQLRQLGVSNNTMTWVASGSAVATPSLNLGGAALDGVYSVTDYVATGNPVAISFAAAYKAKYNATADVNSAYAYDAVDLIAAAIKKAGSTAPASVRQALLGLKNFQGVLGKFTFDSYGDGAHTVNVVKVENGVPTFLETLPLANAANQTAP